MSYLFQSNARGLVWSLYAVPYTVCEVRSGEVTGNPTVNSIYYDMQGCTSYRVSAWERPYIDGYGLTLNPPVSQGHYAVFVMDGEVYVRSRTFFGRGRFLPCYLDSNNFCYGYHLLNMADLGIWRKNYPGFDWDNSCLAKIDNRLVLFECAEHKMDALLLGPMRIAATGRYIPIPENPVAYEDNPDGNGPHPELKTFSVIEEEKLKLYFSCVETPGANRCYASRGYETDGAGNEKRAIIRTVKLDANGDMIPNYNEPDAEGNANPAYFGVDFYVQPGNNALSAQFGDMVFCNDNHSCWATDMKTLLRFMADAKARPAALEQIREPIQGDDGHDNLRECVSIFGNQRGLLTVVQDMAKGETKVPKAGSYLDEWNRVELMPYTLREAVNNWPDNDHRPGTDASPGLPGAKPVWCYPIMMQPRTGGNSSYDIDVSDPDNGIFKVRFCWINPETGAISSPVTIDLAGRNTPDGYGNDQWMCIEELSVLFDLNSDNIPINARLVKSYLGGGTVVEEIPAPSYLDGWGGMPPTSTLDGVPFYVGSPYNWGMFTERWATSGYRCGIKVSCDCEADNWMCMTFTPYNVSAESQPVSLSLDYAYYRVA
jgi:hypothetical protein